MYERQENTTIKHIKGRKTQQLTNERTKERSNQQNSEWKQQEATKQATINSGRPNHKNKQQSTKSESKMGTFVRQTHKCVRRRTTQQSTYLP